jgi:DNA-binding NarL/FixJ family response regulator
MKNITVLLAEDHTIVRKGLCAILGDESDIEVIAEAVDGRDAVRLTEQLQPDVVVMDFSMPGLNGLEATRQIKQIIPAVKVLILTRHTNKEYIYNILQAGASGYLVKKSAPEELIAAIRAVERGDSYLDPSISAMVINGYMQWAESEIQKPDNLITPREREVLQLIAEGRSNQEIAKVLHISVKTVGNHRTNLMDKLSLHSTAELTQYAVRTGMINLD